MDVVFGHSQKESNVNNGAFEFLTPDLIDRKKIDLNPEYQRDVVWSERKMSHLIDSLLQNYYVGEKYVLFEDVYNVTRCLIGRFMIYRCRPFFLRQKPTRKEAR